MATQDTDRGDAVPAGRVKQKRAPPPGPSSTQISWPWASTKALAMERPTPVPPDVPLRLNMRKTSVRSARGTPGPLSSTATCTRPSSRSRADDRDGRVRRGVADGVVEEVGEHLADEQVVDVHERQVVVEGRRDRRTSPASGPEAAQRVGDEVADGDRLVAQLERPGLDPRQVEQVGDEAVEAVGLVVDELEQLLAARGAATSASASRRVEADALIVANGVRRSWDTAPTRARCRRSTSSSSSVRRACSRSCARSRASAMWLAKVCRSSWSWRAERRAPDAEEPDGAARGRQRHRLGLVPAATRSEVPRLAGTPGAGATCRSSASDNGSPADATTSRPVLDGEQQGHAAQREGVVDGGHDELEDLGQRPVLDEEVGELEEPPDGLLVLTSLGARRLQAGHDARHEQHHRHVDAEGDPVLARPPPTACSRAG